MSELILASSSATRRNMLAQAGVEFLISAADLNEAALIANLWDQGADASAIALALAEQKALAVSRRSPGALVLGGDTVLALGPEIITKCHDLAGLRALLQKLSGRGHQLISAAALARDGQVVWQHTATALMTMRRLSPAFLDDYLAAEGEALLSSVGGYHYEARGAQLFEMVEGDFFTILGLPLLPVLAALREHGILKA